MARVIVNKYFCKGCALCVNACPRQIMALDNDEISQKGYHPAYCTDQGRCTGCLSCALMCPDVAITIER